MNNLMIEQLSRNLDIAATECVAIAQLSLEHNFDEQQAYIIQNALIQHRVERGDSITGVKMGFTSREKAEQMGVFDRILGRLTQSMAIADGQVIDPNRFIHPRIEPEIAFRLSRSLSSNCDLSEVMMAVDGIAPALEIIDSRYKNFKFSLADVLADNCSSSGYIIGQFVELPANIANLGMVMSVNGVPHSCASSAAIMGHPGRSIIDAVRLALANGHSLQAGQVLLAGAATPAIPLEPGMHVSLEIESLGSVSVTTSAAK